MGRSLIIVEPNNLIKARKDPNIWRLLYEGDMNTFIDHCFGHDGRLTNMVL